ncbi:toll-like receptor 2 [Littorina saxatilis]|uniref:TIR domain-containing protein n=1 Tax=Littorina saxatilis TaxID=31220 RepID=A0AAN9GAG3_9CAEN
MFWARFLFVVNLCFPLCLKQTICAPESLFSRLPNSEPDGSHSEKNFHERTSALQDKSVGSGGFPPDGSVKNGGAFRYGAFHNGVTQDNGVHNGDTFQDSSAGNERVIPDNSVDNRSALQNSIVKSGDSFRKTSVVNDDALQSSPVGDGDSSGFLPDIWCRGPDSNSSGDGMARDLWDSQKLEDIGHSCPRHSDCSVGTSSRDLETLISPHHCGHGNFCCCCDFGENDYVANCSGHDHSLQQIPKLPANVTVLDFSFNGVNSINSSDFFQRVPKLRYLDIGHNDLRQLHDDAFSLLTNLSVLIMKDNIFLDLSKSMAAVFNVSSLHVLDLSNAYAVTLPKDAFFQYPLHSLKQLNLNRLGLRHWNATTFQSLGALQVLSLADNDMRYISTEHIDGLENVTDLDLKHNDLYDFPKSCFNTRPIYPRLERLNLTDNRITKLSIDVCFPSLRVLDIRSNPIVNLVTNMFTLKYFPSLTCLHLERLHLASIQAYAFNNTALKFLSLMYNYVDFTIENVTKDAFNGLHNLGFLQLEQNYLTNDRFIQLFGHLKALQFVYIGNTYLDEITAGTFAPFPDLTTITMHRNFFPQIPEGVFDHLRHLTHLDVSNSRITTVSSDTFSNDVRGRLRHLDLSGNFFRCDCDLLWFRDWLRAANHTVFNNSWTRYMCRNMPGVPVTDFTINPQVCLLSHDVSVITMVVVTLLILMLTLVAVFFRYRWHIRLLLYEVFRGKGRNAGLPADYFRYDVFVSYAEEDVLWVRHHLVPQLEVRQGLRLCVHQRDFTPGRNIVDNIYHSVHDSRHVLTVFSRHFARSQWCQFELALCLTHVIEHGDTLLVTCVDDVTCSGQLTPTMMAVLNTTTYIQWDWASGRASDRASDAQHSFWARLRLALTDAGRGDGGGGGGSGRSSGNCSSQG